MAATESKTTKNEKEQNELQQAGHIPITKAFVSRSRVGSDSTVVTNWLETKSWLLRLKRGRRAIVADSRRGVSAGLDGTRSGYTGVLGTTKGVERDGVRGGRCEGVETADE
jgi:hypothetical protein